LEQHESHEAVGQQMSWNQFKQVLIEAHPDRVEEDKLPDRFQCSPGLWDVFAEMMEAEGVFGWLTKMVGSKYQDEVLRKIIISNGRFWVQNQDAGIPGRTLAAQSVDYKSTGEVATIHTHPGGKGMPSVEDVLQILTAKHNFEYIVAPHAVTMMLRSTKTRFFADEILAQGYLLELLRQQGKVVHSPAEGDFAFDHAFAAVFEDKVDWEVDTGMLDLADLHHLGIACYQAKRNVFNKKRIFKRKV
jgi:hypothetical protein